MNHNEDPRVDAVAKLLKAQVSDGFYHEDIVYVRHARQIIELLDELEDSEMEAYDER